MVFDPNIGKATQFRKGHPSPNPGGRPKSRLLSEALRIRLAEVKPDDPAASRKSLQTLRTRQEIELRTLGFAPKIGFGSQLVGRGMTHRIQILYTEKASGVKENS